MPPPPGLERTTLATPIGELTVVASGQGIREVFWRDGCEGDAIERRPMAWKETAAPTLDAPATLLHAAVGQLAEYFAGVRRTFELRLDPHGTPFQLAAWRVLQGIPFGTTISYGEQAERLGDPRKARAVGSANGRNPIPIIIPCHRVIGADGSLTGFTAGVERKAWLLSHEAAIHPHADRP